MSGGTVDSAALREQVVRWMRDDDGSDRTIPASPDDVLAFENEVIWLRRVVDADSSRLSVLRDA